MGERGDPRHLTERSIRPWWDLSCQGGSEGALSPTRLGWVGESRGSADPPCLTQCFCREGHEVGTTLLSWMWATPGRRGVEGGWWSQPTAW